MIEAALYIVAGIAFYGGAHQLYLAARRAFAYPHLIHGVMYLLLCGFAVTSALPYQAQSLTALVFAGKLSVFSGLLLWAVFIGFIAAYTNYGPRLLLAALTVVWVLLFILNFAMPYSLLYSDITHAYVSLPDGRASSAWHTRVNPGWSLVQAAMLASLLFALYAAFRLYRTGTQRAALALGSGLLVLSGASVSDGLVAAGLMEGVFLTPFGFLVLLIAAGNRGPQAGIAQQQSAPPIALLALQTPEPAAAPAPAPPPSSESEAESRPPAPPASALRPNEAALADISDNLVDIAVYATLAMNRCKRGSVDPETLETLCRKVRSHAISARRIANRMMRPAAAARPDQDAGPAAPE